jgi:hypothetical protein
LKKSGLLIILIKFFFVLVAGGQLIPNKLNIGLGGVIGIPANTDELYVDGYFRYPAFYGNFTSTPGVTFYIDYKLKENLLLGMHSSHYIFNNWKGDNHLVLLQKPLVNMTIAGPSVSFLPGQSEFSGAFRWGLNMSPFIYSNSFQWIESHDVMKNEIIKRHERDALNFGLKTGLFILHEEETKGFRLDIFYLHSNINSPLLLERSFSSVNLSFSIYMRKMRNPYYLYE